MSFFHQTSLSAALSICIQKQVLEQISKKKKKLLNVKDVPALELLSFSLRAQLQYELCRPYLLRHGFFQFWVHVDITSLEKLCFEAIRFQALLPGDNLFIAL